MSMRRPYDCITTYYPILKPIRNIIHFVCFTGKKKRETDRILEIEATVVFIKHRIVLLLLLASEGTVHYSCWNNFTMDWTKYSSKQDKNTNGNKCKQVHSCGAPGTISHPCWTWRGIRNLETKVKPRVSHMPTTWLRNAIWHTIRSDCVHRKIIRFSLLLLHQGTQCIWTYSLYLHNSWRVSYFPF